MSPEPAQPEVIGDYLGEYRNDSVVGNIRVAAGDDGGVFEINRGKFRLLQVGDKIMIEDVEVPLRLERSATKSGTAELAVAADGTVKGFILYSQ